MGLEHCTSKCDGSLFEPLLSCMLLNLWMKVACLIMIISARRVGELWALISEPPYMVFYTDKVYLHPHPKFLTKVVSNFHINQAVYLPTFFLKPHKLKDEKYMDIGRALGFYLDLTKVFRSTLQLLIAVEGTLKGSPMSSQWIFSLISASIFSCYHLANMTPLSRVLAQATRSHADSVAFLTQMPILDICKVAAWL